MTQIQEVVDAVSKLSTLTVSDNPPVNDIVDFTVKLSDYVKEHDEKQFKKELSAHIKDNPDSTDKVKSAMNLFAQEDTLGFASTVIATFKGPEIIEIFQSNMEKFQAVMMEISKAEEERPGGKVEKSEGAAGA